MAIPLLATKLYIPPTRPEAVARPRLTEKLRAGLDRPGSFALLSGPAGFGKTTLLSAWIAELRAKQAESQSQTPALQFAWLSLDEGDNDPARFWTYVITACQSVQAEVGQQALRLIHSAQPLPAEMIPTLLINDLTQLEGRLVLVLDDYHAIQNEVVHTAFFYFLEHLPESLHLVLSTRSDPPWPLARLRAHSRLVEIRAQDLRFSNEETATFLNQRMGLDLSAEDVAALERRTEGWIAGLQLAALSMQGQSDISGFVRAFTGSHLYVAEYLLEEVLQRQPADVQVFLLRTSILDRMNAELCHAVIDESRSPKPEQSFRAGDEKGAGDASLGFRPGSKYQLLLETLKHANLFLIPLDDQRGWYRYHHLFADLLRARLQEAYPAETIAALHRRAASWYEQNGFTAEAIHHALTARDFKGAARLVEQNAYAMLTRGQLSTLLRWTEMLPQDLVRENPQIIIAKVWALTLAGAIQQVEPILQQIEAENGMEGGRPSGDELRGNAAAIRAFFAMMAGKYVRAQELAETADRLLPERSVHARWLMPFTLGAVYRGQGQYKKAVEAFARQVEMGKTSGDLITWATGAAEIAITQRQQGKLHAAAETCLQTLEAFRVRGARQYGSLAKVEVPLIEVLCEQNKLEEAWRRVTDVLERLKSWPMPTDRVFACLAQIMVQEAQGDLEGAFKTLTQAKELKAAQPVLRSLARSVEISEVRLRLARGEITEAARLIETLQSEAVPVVYQRAQALVLLARVRLTQGRLDEALHILDALQREPGISELTGIRIEILTLQASARQANGDRQEALSALLEALRLAEPQGFVRIFLNGGKGMRDLIAECRMELGRGGDGRLLTYAQLLLEAFGEHNHSGGVLVSGHTPQNDSSLVEPLSAREMEVLQLIALGDSNQMIATKLFITVSAVKKHTSNIFGKLSVSSRTQAAARARQLGLIPKE